MLKKNIALLLLCAVISAGWLFLIDELSIKTLIRYTAICCSLLLINRSRSLKNTNAHMLIVGIIIISGGLIALFFHWPLSYEICLLGAIFVFIGYASFVKQYVQAGVFEYLSLAVLFLGLSYLISKLIASSSAEILEIVGEILLFILFVLQGYTKAVSRSTAHFSEKNHNNVLV
jgi:hypothetical protein